MSLTCNECGSKRIEEVMINVTVSTEISFDKDGDIVYGEQTNEDGEVDCFQCVMCGNKIANNEEELKELLGKA